MKEHDLSGFAVVGLCLGGGLEQQLLQSGWCVVRASVCCVVDDSRIRASQQREKELS
jgi:hypothetical protein